MINGFGGAALDTIHHISHWPEADNTCYIKESKVEPGGMVLGALIAASRLGAAVMYSGALGDDKEGLILQEYMNRNRIDTGCCSILKGEQTPVSQIMTDPEGRRTIFHNKGLRSSDYHVELNSQLLDGTDILLLDGSWIENALCMAEKALKKYIPIILDLSPNNTHPLRDDLIRSSDYPILSEILAARISGTEDNSEQALVLQKRFGRTIIITAGNRGVFRADGSKRVRHSPAFKVKTVDTTGAGDTFHGAFAAALLEGLDLDESIRFAMGTAALKCTNRGWDHLPESKTVRTFIEQESNNE